jgi:hypothetical protein
MPLIIMLLLVGLGCLGYGWYKGEMKSDPLVYTNTVPNTVQRKPDCYTADQAMALSGNRTMSFIIASKPRC